LLPFHGDFAQESKTVLLGYRDNYLKKTFFAGFILGKDSVALNLEIELLTSIADKYSNKFSFVVFESEDSKTFLQKTDLTRHGLPLFFVFQSGNIGAGRWFLKGEKAHNQTIIENFLNGIANWSIPFTILSKEFEEDPPDRNLKQVNALTAEKLILTNKSATILLLAATWCAHCREWKPIVHAAADLLANENIKFFWMDAPENDLLKFIPEYAGFPAMWIWPVGENWTKPENYGEERDLGSLLNWIRKFGGVEFKVPEVGEDGLVLIAKYKLANLF
jgi:thiol-disulfide isomerase/thioredoxin